MTAQRPALADVLARVTTCDDAAWWRDLVGRYGARIDAPVVLGVVRNGSAYDVGRLRHPTPADALGALVEAELLPEHWARELTAPRWWCPQCGERGERHVTAAPPSHAALVAVASLGVDTLARAEAIVAETWPGRALVWRVMGTAEIREHHERCKLYSGGAATALEAFSREQVAAYYFGPELGGFGGDCKPPWPAEPFTTDSAEVRRAWPALRALAALGLHLVALDAGRVVLAVEALA